MSKKKRKQKNPVAKHARTFNKASVFEDKKKAWKKGKQKHKNPRFRDDSGIFAFRTRDVGLINVNSGISRPFSNQNVNSLKTWEKSDKALKRALSDS